MSATQSDGNGTDVKGLQQRRDEAIRLVQQPDSDSSKSTDRSVAGTLFDGENTPQNIAVYGFFLGTLGGGGILFALLVDPQWHVPQFGIFLTALSLFHLLEYLATALYNPDKLSLDSFLINHSPHYHAAHAAAFLEFVIEYYFVPGWKTFGWLNYIGKSSKKRQEASHDSSSPMLGFVLVLIGQFVRTTAMFSAGHNFSHQIQDERQRNHVLVQHGIYSIMRHPSYFGFYWWAIGVQFLLLNPICLCLFVYWLHRFFAERIEYEEYTLQRFFKDEWNSYKARVPTWMPFIP